MDNIWLVSALCGFLSSVLTLVTAAALFMIPALTPVGRVVAVFLSATVLSLPIWAIGLFYSFYADALDIPQRIEQVLKVGSGGSVALYGIGVVAVWSQRGSLRTIGDGLYVIATLLLLVISGATLLAEARNLHR